jgi:hypothetical protein
MPHPIATLVICCGPGLSGCTQGMEHCATFRPNLEHEWVQTQPGTIALSGTGIVVTYDASTDAFKVEGHGANRITNTLDEAIDTADRLIEHMESVGIKP